MRKTLTTLLMSQLFLMPVAFAQSAVEPNSEQTMPVPQTAMGITEAELKLDYLITQDFDRFERLIRDKSQDLELSSRYRLYLSHHSAENYGASLLNVIPGGGVGSFTMGDTAGGWLLLGGELAAGLLVGIGSVSGDRTLNSALTGIAALCFAGFRLYGMYRPLQFSGEYNQRLKRSLNLLDNPYNSQQSLLTAPTFSLSWDF